MSPKGTQEGLKSYQKAAQEQLESTKGNVLNLRARLHGSVILRGRGRSGRALGGQVGGQNGAQVRLGSPTWWQSAAEQPTLAVQVQLGAQLDVQV